ncbi:hypothetical protein GBA52_020980 [Prunus armeniaca]|nr:hypothetical protein GBA52_020980 [Prunus armeniaca]
MTFFKWSLCCFRFGYRTDHLQPVTVRRPSEWKVWLPQPVPQAAVYYTTVEPQCWPVRFGCGLTAKPNSFSISSLFCRF